MGTVDELRPRIHKVIARALERSPETIEDRHHFLRDLSIDSVAVIEILCALEKEFDLTINEFEVFPIETVGELVEILRIRQVSLPAR
jgi:acyl carrier protein